MRKVSYLGFSLVLLLALTRPGLAQQAPAYKSTAEGNAYVTFFNEADPKKKAEMGEKFLTDFKDSDFRSNAVRIVMNAYMQSQNFPKVMETADKLPTLLPNADTNTKSQVYTNAMLAAQQ